MPLERILQVQAGIVTGVQAIEAGLNPRTVQRRVSSGQWRELYPRVYLVGGHRLTDEAKVRAAWLGAGGAPAVVTAESAVYWHRITVRPPAQIEVTVPTAARKRPRPGIQLRRRDLDGLDVCERRGIRVARKPLAVLESVASHGSTFLDRALQRHVTLPEVRTCYRRNLGAHGWPEVARLLAAAADGAESEAERMLVNVLREAGVAGWVLGHPFGPYTIDLAFPAARVAVEVDGWAWHSGAAQFAADRRKGNALTRAGWKLLRFTWHDLDAYPGDVLAQILAAI